MTPERDEDGQFVADEDEPDEDVLHSKWKSYDKYSCGICKQFHNLGEAGPVEAHIEQEHEE